jgi:hypothetical protein
MKLYIFLLKRKNKNIRIKGNAEFFLQIEKNIVIAEKKANNFLKDFEVILVAEMPIWKLIYTFPLFKNRKEVETQKKL